MKENDDKNASAELAEEMTQGEQEQTSSSSVNPADAISAEDLSPDDFSQLLAKAAKSDELMERLLRERADFENYKKRAARERTDATKYANESILQKLIPVLDNFEMALNAVSSDQGNSQSMQQGVSMIYTQLKSALQEAGLEQIEAAGEVFNPALHEAVSAKETTEVPDGTVLQQLRKGYRLRERLVRPATVIVAKAP